jgi:intein/homing endonuclease
MLATISVAQIRLDSLPKTCLPTKGRMMPNDSYTCDCVNKTLKLTPVHPVMTKEGWKAIQQNSDKMETSYGLKKIGKLVVGDVLLTDKGDISVKTIKPYKTIKDGTTYNLKLQKPYNSFYANGILVKNHL